MKTTNPDRMTEDMARAGSGQPVLEKEGGVRPQTGDQFRCASCGMEVQVTAGCNCPDEDAHFHCCGQEMRKV
jgi:hypothetical protein